jgi:hypothetical protein
MDGMIQIFSSRRRHFIPLFPVTDNFAFRLVFCFVFIPWLQKELDAYRDRVNNTTKRADRNKVLPHGVPNDMFKNPGDFGVLDFKVHSDIYKYICSDLLTKDQAMVRQDAIDQVRNLYAPKDHTIFQLVPPNFAVIINQLYCEIGQPPVTRQSCWDIYLQLLNCFHALDDVYNIPHGINEKWGYALTMARDNYAKEIELIPNLPPLHNGDSVIGPDGFYYMGGVNNGEGLGESPSHC